MNVADLPSSPGRGASFSPDGRYRYTLRRVWDDAKAMVLFVMLNPSIADACQDDPTVRRCQNYAQDWGYGGLWVGNLFAYISTDPSALRDVADPVGPDNDVALLRMHQGAAMTVAAWGTRGGLLDRDKQVREMLTGPVYCLHRTKQGQPGHPGRLPKSATPMLLWE